MQLPDIELSELRYFHCVATARSFAEGARRAHVSASTVSKAIKKLEETLGVVLLDRSSRHVALTEAGEAVLARAGTVLDSICQLSEAADDASGRVRGDLQVGCTEEFAAHALHLALARLARVHAELRVHTYLMGPHEIERRLLDGELDLGLVFGGVTVAEDLRSEVLICSPISLVCGRGHPLHERGAVKAEALREHPFVVPRFFGERGSGDHYPAAGPPRTIGATVELVQMAIQMVVEGGFLAYLPDVMIRCQLNHGELVRLEGLPSGDETELCAWQRPGASTRTRTLIAAVELALRETLRLECVI